MGFRIRLTSLVSLLYVFVTLAVASRGDASGFEKLGTPVRDAVCWGGYAGPGKTGAFDTVYLSFSQYEAPLFLLSVRPDTGEIRQYNGPLSTENGAWGFTVGQDRRIYLGSHHQARLLRFDPKTETWEDLGRPCGETETYVCKLTTAPDGKIWGGTFPSAQLFSYDPKTGETRQFGRMDPDQFYCYPTAGDDGLIYCVIQFERKNIVVLDPKTGSKTSLIPSDQRNPGRVYLIKGSNGKIYVRYSNPERYFRIDEENRLKEISESDVPFPPRDLVNGWQFTASDGKVLLVENPVTQERKEILLRYEASGAFIFVVGSGPEGRIYGSSMLPLRLFAYTSEHRSLVNLGKASFATGEVYSMATVEGRLYFCSYPDARLSVYDPKKPWNLGDREDSNPRDLGPMGGDQYRPRAMIAGPNGRLYIGSYPDYGLLGGAIMVYDPKKGEKRVYRHVVKNQSIASLTFLEKMNLIAAGSSVRGGTATRPVEKGARLVLWGPKEEEKVFEMTPVPGAGTILSLASTDEGIVYGITENEKVFAFDPEKREVRKVTDLGFKEPRAISLQAGSDGRLYGLAREAIFSIDPKTHQATLVASPPVPITSGMAIQGRSIYFGSGADLWQFEIPAPPDKAEP